MRTLARKVQRIRKGGPNAQGHVRQLRADACGKPHLRLIKLGAWIPFSFSLSLSSFVRGVNAEAALGCAGRQAFDASGAGGAQLQTPAMPMLLPVDADLRSLSK